MRLKTSLLSIVVGLILLSWLPVVDDYGDRYTSKALTQAAVTYGVARGINGLVSVLQTTEVSIGIASVSPGEFLDPLNDLIERFSWVAMMAMASLGFQKLLLVMASSLLFKVLLSITGVFFIYSLFKMNGSKQNAMLRLFIVALFLRFAVGAVVFANNIVEYYFLEDTKAKATEGLSETSLSLSDINLNGQKKKDNVWDGIKGSLSGGNEDKIMTQTENATNNILDLTVAYIAQAIIFPFVFLWAFYKVFRWVWAFDWANYLLGSKEHDHKKTLGSEPI